MSLHLLADAAYAATITVTTTTDEDSEPAAGVGCSLREAITTANTDTAYGGCTPVGAPGADTIEFDLGALPLPLPHRIGIDIAGEGQLPAIVDSVAIDGWSQGPEGYTGPPLVWIDGVEGLINNGLQIDGDEADDLVMVRGLALTRFETGILIVGIGEHSIVGSYVGGRPELAAAPGGSFVATATVVDLPGGCACADSGNGYGIYVLGDIFDTTPTHPTVTIGGVGTGEGNVIVANFSFAVGLFQTTDATLLGNFIGTDRTGADNLGNDVGVYLDGTQGIDVGDGTQEGRNIVSGNDGGQGIHAVGSEAIRIRGNYVGIGPDGSTALANGIGVVVDGISEFDLGGATPGDRNVISGNDQDGVYLLQVCGCVGDPPNLVRGNYIGLNAAGTDAVPNLGNGIHIFDTLGVVIGGTGANDGNVISGNGMHGVLIEGEFAEDIELLGNRIGTNAAGTVARGNTLDGISLIPVDEDINELGPFDIDIGRAEAGAGNLISGNLRDGIYLLNTEEVNIRGNVIGLAIDGVTPLPNFDGVHADFSVDLDIGGDTAAARNVISGNTEDGVVLISCGCDFEDTEIQGNYIGVRSDGSAAVPNGANGVLLVDGFGILVGGNEPGQGNLVSGNALDGISVVGEFSIFVEVAGNRVGTNASGTAAIPNGRDGVSLLPGEFDDFGPQATLVGSDEPGTGNLISSNGRHGVYAVGQFPADPPIFDIYLGTLIGHNLIGVDASGSGSIPNARSGVFLQDSAGVVVFENIIANNGRAGVLVTPATGTEDGNVILTNAIFNNAGLGIDVTDDANPDSSGNTVTPNDLTESDDVQNFPVITAATTSAAGTVIGGTLTSIPNEGYRVELFASPSCDPTGNGEGRAFLGGLDAGTGPPIAPNGTGVATFSTTVGALPLNHVITATATNHDFKTSEFSACFPVTTAAIQVTPTTGLTTTEAGGQATFTVALTTIPVVEVTVGLTSSDTSEGTVSPSSLTFQPNATALEPQTVTLTGVADAIADGNQNYSIVTAPAVSTDPAYSGMDAPDVQAVNQDSGVVPTLSIEPNVVTEGTGVNVPISFTVKLTPASTQTVTVNWQVVEGTAQLGQDIELPDSAGGLTFNPGEVTKSIVVRIRGDSTPEPTETFTVRLQESSGAAIGVQTATGTIEDDDVAAGPCSPRPNVAMTVTRTGANQLVVSVEAGVGTLKKITFASADQPMQNAQIETIGPASVIQGFGVLTPPPNVTQQSFVVRRILPNQPVMVSLIVEDGCGDWKTFVGTGSDPW